MLMDTLGLVIPDQAKNDIADAYMYLHKIPAAAILSTMSYGKETVFPPRSTGTNVSICDGQNASYGIDLRTGPRAQTSFDEGLDAIHRKVERHSNMLRDHDLALQIMEMTLKKSDEILKAREETLNKMEETMKRMAGALSRNEEGLKLLSKNMGIPGQGFEEAAAGGETYNEDEAVDGDGLADMIIKASISEA